MPKYLELLGLQRLISRITPANIGAAPAAHSHPEYAGVGHAHAPGVKRYPITLSALWPGGEQAISNVNIKPPNESTVWVDVADAATAPQKDAFDAAWICPVSQTNGGIIIKAHGTAPTATIPAMLIVTPIST